MKGILTRVSAGVAALVLAAGAGAATYALLADGSSTAPSVTVAGGSPTADTSGNTVSDVYERTNASVVEITVTISGDAAQGSGASQAQGSGFVYDSSGHVVTNQHVVDGAGSIQVKFANGTTTGATVVGTDPSTDLAVLKLDSTPSGLEPLTLADSSAVDVGDEVVAIGSPFGLENSVTSGIVSALDRSMEAPNGFTINGSIQTDAAINHGNSGGPLLDMNGRVIGVTAQIESDSGGNDGVGFAIPSNTVRAIATQLIANGSVQHAYLGVTVGAAQGGTTGVQVTDVRADGPAASAGLQAGDVITSVDGKDVATTQELQAAIDAKHPGDKVSIGYVRNGADHTVSVTLGTRPS
jgi:putative serine protease PepD